MNKFITKVAKLVLGLSLAAGVGVAVGSQSKASRVDAAWTQGGVFNKMTNASLSAGDVVIFVNDAGTYALGDLSATSSGYGTTVGVTVSNNSITLASNSSVVEFVVEAGASSGYAFKAQNGTNFTNYYMAYTSTATSKSNYLNRYGSNTSSNTQGQFTLTYSSSHMQVRSVYNTGRWMRFNSDRFACYYSANSESGTGTAVQVYKKAANVAVTGVTVSPTEVTLGVGATQQLTPTVSPNNATNKTVSYSSNATNVATVSSSGLITAVAAGNATITVTTQDGSKTATCAVTVTAPVAVSGVSLNKNSTSIEVGSTETLTATVAPNDASNKTVNWTTSDSNVATVSGGVVTAVGKGSAIITVTTADGGYTATCSVTVTAPSSVTFTAGTDVGTSSGQNPDTISKTGISMHCTSVHDTDTAYRFYSGSTLTISSSIGNIAKIEFNMNGSYNSNLLSAGTGSYDSSNSSKGIWTGSAASIAFSLSAQARVNSVVVTLASTEPSVELNNTSIDLSIDQTSGLTVTATVQNVATPTYSWVANNGNVILENDNTATVTIKPNTNVAANSTVTLTVGGTTPNLTATVTVSITVPGPGESAGTAFTVSEARTHIDSVVTGGESTGNDGNYYYAAGIVSAIVTPYDSTYHNITYTISADGLTTSAQLEAYRGKGLNGANFTSDDDIAVGDQVVIYGQLKIYNGTYEFDANNYLVSRIAAPQVHSITFTPSVVEVAPDDAGDIVDLFTSIVINQDTGANKTVSDIVWSSGDANVFYVDGDEYLVAGAHKDSTTLYASIGGKQLGSATIEVVDPDHPFIVYDVPEEWTIVTDASALQAGDQIIITDEDSTVGMLAYSTGNNCKDTSADGETAIAVSGSKMTNTGTAGILTLSTANSSDGTFYLNDGSHYLYAASSSANQLKGKNSTDSSNGAFKFSYSSTMTIYAYGSSNRNYICYNDSSALFSCYASDKVGDYKGLQVYKKSGGDASTLDLDNTILNLVHSHMSTYKDEHNNDQYGIAICDYNGATLDKNDWDDMGSDFTSSIINTYKLNYARSNASGNDVEKFLSAYDYVVAKYGSTYDFLGRIATGKVTVSGGAKVVLNNVIGGNTNTVAIIVIISLVSVTAIGGYFFLKRREQN